MPAVFPVSLSYAMGLVTTSFDIVRLCRIHIPMIFIETSRFTQLFSEQYSRAYPEEDSGGD
ncbi:MAG: hypothetical protein RPU37_11025 [Candidatus Sedimenticola sp. (ex Thyasira tokunagai)]